MTILFYDERGDTLPLPEGVPIQQRTSVYAIIPHPEHETQILLVQPVGIRDRWMLPGGGVESKEDNLQALKRECREEVGYNIIVQLSRPFFISTSHFYSRKNDIFYFSHNCFYFARIKTVKNQKSYDTEEIGNIVWMERHMLHRQPFFHHVLPAIKELLRRNEPL